MKNFLCDAAFRGATLTAEITWRRTKYGGDKNEWLDGRFVRENDHDIPYGITSVIPKEVRCQCMKTATSITTGKLTKKLSDIRH